MYGARRVRLRVRLTSVMLLGKYLLCFCLILTYNQKLCLAVFHLVIYLCANPPILSVLGFLTIGI